MRPFLPALLLLFTAASLAAGAPPDDADMLETLAAAALDSVFAETGIGTDMPVQLIITDPNTPTVAGQAVLERAVTRAGVPLTDIPGPDVRRLTIGISEALVLIEPAREGFRRTIFLTVQAALLDNAGVVLHASNRVLRVSDTLAKENLLSTDTAGGLGFGARRVTLDTGPGALTLAMLAVSTVVLAFFAFQ